MGLLCMITLARKRSEIMDTTHIIKNCVTENETYTHTYIYDYLLLLRRLCVCCTVADSLMARMKEETELLTRQLILRITGFEVPTQLSSSGYNHRILLIFF